VTKTVVILMSVFVFVFLGFEPAEAAA